MSEIQPVVELFWSGETLVLRPGKHTTIRALERTLSSCAVQRGPGVLYLHPADAEIATKILHDWKLRLEPAVKEYLRSKRAQRARLMRAREALEQLQQADVARRVLCDFDGVSRLDAHQIIAVAAASHEDVFGFCLFDEQGLGKTVTTLYSFARLRSLGVCTRALVICPKNMILEWVQDATRFLPQLTVTAVTGTRSRKRQALLSTSDIFVTNFETAIHLRWRLQQLLEAEREKALLAIDESFFVKNRDAKRTRAIRELRAKVDRCIVLCGTPAPNSPHDLVEQFNIADGGVTFQGVDLPDDREMASRVVQQAIDERGVYLRRLKHEVLPRLPGKSFHHVFVPMAPFQRGAYAAALGDFVVDLRKETSVSFERKRASYLARRSRLLQICSNPASVIPGYSETPGKISALDSILEELITHRAEKVVVWSFYRESLKRIFLRYQAYNPVRVDGTVAAVEARREAVRRFQEDDESMLFVGNPAAAGAGITLHRARYAVYESLSNQSAHYLQSVDRIHRRGQTRACEYLILLCDRTIEAREYDRLCQKEIAAGVLLRDRTVPAMTYEALLAEAEDAASLLG